MAYSLGVNKSADIRIYQVQPAAVECPVRPETQAYSTRFLARDKEPRESLEARPAINDFLDANVR
jgi:hypothetical protein